MNKGAKRCAAAMAALLWSFAPAWSQDVTLTSLDGTLEISGEFRSFDGEFYRISSRFGLLTVDAQGVLCDGPACPDLTGYVAEVRLVGEAEAGARYLPGLIGGFAGQKGLALSVAPEDGGMVFTLSRGQDELAVARFVLRHMDDSAVDRALREGNADFGLSPMPVADHVAMGLGSEALVAVVSPENPVRTISSGDLARVLAGEVANWAVLGGPDLPLVLHGLAPASGFVRAVEAGIGQPVVANRLHPDGAALDAAIARDPWGIALTRAGAVTGSRVLDLVDSCGFHLQPTPLSVMAQDYPLVQQTYVVQPRRRLPLVAREFLAFLALPATTALGQGAGLVPTEPLLADGRRLANAIRAAGEETGVAELQRLTVSMKDRERLALSFRFEEGSDRFDAASRANLDKLVRLIEAGLFEDRQLTLAGFSDGSGAAPANIDVSRRRAEQLQEAIAEAVPDLGDLRVRLEVQAFGEALPLACDESAIGRHLNRRVEVWVGPIKDTPATGN